jgi:hypothetical protein
VVINAETGDPIYVGDGTGAVALDGFWDLLGKRRMERIEAVAMDFEKAYISAVAKHLPGAVIASENLFS